MTHERLCVVCYECLHTVGGRRNWWVWFETIWKPNSSRMAVFFRLSAAAEDKIKKSWRGREKEKENMRLATEKGCSKEDRLKPVHSVR